jgi:hypothetical protein
VQLPCRERSWPSGGKTLTVATTRGFSDGISQEESRILAASRRTDYRVLSRQWMLAEPAPRTERVSSSVANPRTCRQLRTDVRNSTRREAGRSARRVRQDAGNPTSMRLAVVLSQTMPQFLEARGLNSFFCYES